MHSDAPPAPLSAFRSWMLDCALPLWKRAGTDPRGGFHEMLDTSVRPVEAPRRTRLVARQLFVWSVAHRLGWIGAGPELVEHGWAALQRHILGSTGFAIASATATGEVIDPRFSRYDQAFVLLALAELVRAMPGLVEPVAVATRIRDGLMPLVSDGPADDAEAFLANPLMHVFEALLAWTDVPGADPCWQEHAARIAALVVERLFDARCSVIREHFDRGWRVASGPRAQVVEPGHLFEWATLLLLWNRRHGSALAGEIASCLASSAERAGIGPHGFVMNEIADTLAPIDTGAKLWQQCERLRYHCSAHAARQACGGAQADQAAVQWALLSRFLSCPTAGLWHDQADSNGAMIAAPTKASTLYHLTTAFIAAEALSTPAGGPSAGEIP